MTDPRNESTIPVAERMSDVSDMATAREAEFLDDAIRRSQVALVQKQKPLPDGSYPDPDCEDCGLEIGEQRLRLAPCNTKCFDCQSASEQRRRLFT